MKKKPIPKATISGSVPHQERSSWAFWLNCPPATFDQAGLHLIPNPHLDEQAALSVLTTGANTIVSIPEASFTYYANTLRPLTEMHLATLTDIINALRDDIERYGYLLWQGVLAEADFQPHPDPRVRRLSQNGLVRLKTLKQACHPVEWDHSCLNDQSDCTFGYFIGDSVVAAAHYVLLRGELASIGVLTHPAHRGRGYSTAAASAAVQHALESGYHAHYQTLLENRPAITLAGKLGYRFFGFSMKLWLRSIQPG